MLINFDDEWVPESSIRKLERIWGGTPPHNTWRAELTDGDVVKMEYSEPTSRTVVPNTTGIRLLFMWGDLDQAGTFTHGQYERAIVAWTVDAGVSADEDAQVSPIACDGDHTESNVVRCCFDPVTGAHWDEWGTPYDTREEAVEQLAAELRDKLLKQRQKLESKVA
jgi:hypothetical protein